MDQIKIPIKCVITPTNPATPIGITVLIDDQVIYTNPTVTEQVTVTGACIDNEAAHVLRFVLSGKTSEMTKIDEAGNIVQDTLLHINELQMDDIDITTVLHLNGEYEHDFNGTGAPTQEKFHGTIGCNGTVSLKFNTPFYIWLLENM